MNTPQQARPAGNRDRVARHARAGPEPVLSTIPQQPGPEAEVTLPPGQPAGPDPRGARIVRSWRYLLPALAGGTVATAIPAARALGWPADVRTAAGPWLATAAAILGIALSQMITDMYRDRQRTRRKEIEQHAAEAMATALAQLINAAHTKAQNLSAAKEMEETARVRDSARQVTVDLVAAITALAQLPDPASPAGSQERHEN
jgi:hypothetical protein